MKRRHLLFTLSYGAAALLLGGCRPESGTPAGATTGEKPSVRLAFFPNVTHAAALYGSSKGLFQKAVGDSATVEERVFKAGPEEIEALFAGEVDLGYIGPGPAINGYLKSRGAALKIVAGASSGGAALIARGDVPIAGVKDLAGKRVAVPQKGGTQDISLRHALQAAGLASKDKGGTVDVVQFAPSDTLDMFRRKEIDAAWLPEPWVARLEADAGAKLVIDERTLWPEGKFSTTVVIVRSTFLQQHPELVAKLVAAHRTAVEAIAKDPDAARATIGEKIKGLSAGKAIPDAILKTALSRTQITADPLKDTVLTFADWSKALGYLREDRSALNDLFVEIPKGENAP